MYVKKLFIRPFYHTAEKLDFIGSSTFGFKEFFKIFKCLVNRTRYTRTNLIWKCSVRDFCFGSSSVHHATPFVTKEVSLFIFEMFQKYSASKDYFGP